MLGCESPHVALGLCEMHHGRARRGGDPSGVRRASPKEAGRKFREAAEAKGITVIGDYVDRLTPIHCLCINDHEWHPIPGNALAGSGQCRKCEGTDWDAFYVVTDGRTVKFGITWGTALKRLAEHARDSGLTERLRVIASMPEGAAKRLEDQCRAALRDEGAVPARGREYFDAEWTWLILSIVDRFS